MTSSMGTSFLGDAARSLVRRYGTDLSGLTLVFPTRRAGLFFDLELQALGAASVSYATPHTTIDRWIGRWTALKPADELLCLSELYKIYRETSPDEPFEQWAPFGKLLLADFDSVDKYLVDAAQLYSVLSDTRQVEAEFRDESYEAALAFWRTFSPSAAERHQQQEFLRIWQSLHGLYTRLRAALEARGVGYSGMIYRSAAERPTATPAGKPVFIGLNALSRSERAVMERAGGEFLWDYDPSWLTTDPPHQAAYFLANNLRIFPQAEWFERSACEAPQIEAVAVPTQIAQCKALPDLLADCSPDRRTGIVLTDEGLIVPLLHSLPAAVGSVNVSVGYPIGSTAAYGLVRRTVELYTTYRPSQGFRRSALLALLRHPLVGRREEADELAARDDRFFAFDTLPEPAGRSAFELNAYLTGLLEQVETELPNERTALRLILDELNALWARIAAAELPLTVRGYTALLFEALGALRLPFEGRSGEGVQVLGILESRALDFENLVVLSMDDANFPDAHTPTSYIPQNLRTAYGLPSTAEHNAIWSYYFFRLLPRARRVRLLYCGAGEREPSRYLRQLRYLYNMPFVQRTLDAESTRTEAPAEIEAAKTSEIVGSLLHRRLSPSALNRYALCPFRFYLSDVAGVRPLDEESDRLSAVEAGDVLHRVLHKLYEPTVGAPDAAAELRAIERNVVKKATDEVLRAVCGTRVDPSSASVGIVRTAVERMAAGVVAYDAARSELFAVEGLEREVEAEWVDASGRRIRVGGTVDRLDRLADGRLRVVDYKSGGDRAEYRGVESLFEGSSRNGAVLQLLVYGVVLRRQYGVPVEAALYAARKMGAGVFDPAVECSDEVLDAVEARIEGVFGEWADATKPFVQTPHRPEFCRVCPYAAVCQQ